MIILYSTDCPKCQILKKKLNSKGIEFKEETNVDKMFELNIVQVPVLQVEDKLLDFSSAVKYINNR